MNLRYKLPGKSASILISQPVAANSKPLAPADDDTRFAIAVAAYAQQLGGGQYNGKMSWNDIIRLARQADKPDPYGLRSEFIELAKIAQSLSAGAASGE